MYKDSRKTWVKVLYSREYGRRVFPCFEDYIDVDRSSLCWHRVGGPALIWSNDEEEFWLDDEFYAEEEYKKAIEDVQNMSEVMRLTDPRWWVREWK